MDTDQPPSEHELMQLNDAVLTAVEGVCDQFPGVDRYTVALAVAHGACHLSSGRGGVTRLITELVAHYRIGQPPVTLPG